MDYSAVEIREENILALRSFLLEGPEAWVPLQDDMQKDDETAAGYMSLLFGAFNVAVRRRFSPTYTVGEIVRFVADLRIMAGEDGYVMNALVAEDLIRRAVGAPPPRDGGPDDAETVLPVQIIILLYLIAEADFDRAGLEQFIEETIAYTEQWLDAQANGANSYSHPGRPTGGPPRSAAGERERSTGEKPVTDSASMGRAEGRDVGREPSRGEGGSWEAS